MLTVLMFLKYFPGYFLVEHAQEGQGLIWWLIYKMGIELTGKGTQRTATN